MIGFVIEDDANGGWKNIDGSAADQKTDAVD